MSCPYEAVLLIAFGGPESRDEIRPFLARVLEGTRIPSSRLEEVVRHYEAVGGGSPLNQITERQAEAVQKLLDEHGVSLPVYVGMRNARPFFTETLQRMTDAGITRALGFILSSYQAEASWERYMMNIATARQKLSLDQLDIEYCGAWYDHPLFIELWVERIATCLAQMPAENRGSTPVVFTAHSIPTAMPGCSRYVGQFHTTARLVAEGLDHRRWSVAYQSRSGNPADPWLEPDIVQVIRELSEQGVREVVVAPTGFVCDHVEVLYDLDIEAKNIATGLGIQLFRVACPNDHPTFIRMIADVIEGKLGAAKN